MELPNSFKKWGEVINELATSSNNEILNGGDIASASTRMKKK